MPSFGEKLKLEREKRKITLEQISSSTKIGTRMLQALEDEKFNQLPGGIFNKGFVRAYARVVGIDEDQAVADYLQASGDAAPARPELVTRESTVREEEENRISRLEAISDSASRPLPWGAFAVILLAIALALSLWSHRRHEQERLAARTSPAKTAGQSSGTPSQEGASLSTSGSGSAIQPSPVSAPINSVPTAATTSAATSSDKTFPTSARKTSDQTSAQNSQSAGGAPATPAPGEFMVVIQAREESWVSIAADGKVVPQEVLQAGSERAIRGRKLVVVKAGNAGGLDFRLNGKKLDVGGEFGEVKTVTIGPAGLLPNASIPPATP